MWEFSTGWTDRAAVTAKQSAEMDGDDGAGFERNGPPTEAACQKGYTAGHSALIGFSG